jgi:hypothetical protein
MTSVVTTVAVVLMASHIMSAGSSSLILRVKNNIPLLIHPMILTSSHCAKIISLSLLGRRAPRAHLGEPHDEACRARFHPSVGFFARTPKGPLDRLEPFDIALKERST